ncbi:phospholipid carrier-dependent glycosyltransferase [bacterium]|nr:phospholipid carrier-dependent glycosyltransferase [bacterium]
MPHQNRPFSASNLIASGPETALERLYSRLNRMPDRRLFLISSVVLFLGFWILFAIYIQFPQSLNFDEFHYIPSARQWLQWVENKNYEHPPLAKQLIALSLAIFGDRPIGWRLMSSVFGSLTILGTYVAALALFRTQISALFTALITGFNCMVYVQSRIAMLDTFMMAFLMWAMALGLCVFFPLHPDPSPQVQKRRQMRTLNFSGVALGLACACKWFAIIPWVSLGVMISAYRVLKSWDLRFGKVATQTDLAPFYPLPSTTISKREFAQAWIFLPVLVYFSTFIPFLWVTKADGGSFTFRDILFGMQLRMWNGQLNVISPHPYSSTWTQWPLLTRPIWYAFEPSADKQWVRGVLLICNPVIAWGGFAAVMWTFWDWLRSRTFAALWIVSTYACFTLSWALIPRKLTFFYYYYPSALMLSFACAYVLKRNSTDLHPEDLKSAPMIAHLVILGLTIAVFAYFFPILSALKIPYDRYIDWMWFKSWI